jgi:hypothetical protein
MVYMKVKPEVELRIHQVLAGVWAVLLVPSLLWWKDSILWIIVISVYANIAGHWAGVQAAKADINSPDSKDKD